jgi:hypothetical protein
MNIMTSLNVLAFLFLGQALTFAQAPLGDSTVSMVIAPTQNPTGSGHSYTIDARPGNTVWISLAPSGDSASRIEVNLENGHATLNTEVTARGNNTVKFSAWLSVEKTTYYLTYVKNYPKPVIYSYYQASFVPALYLRKENEVAYLDAMLPFAKQAVLKGKTYGGAVQNMIIHSRINNKSYVDHDFPAVQLQVGLVSDTN